MPRVLSINIGQSVENPYKKDAPTTGFDKRPTDQPIEVRAPGPKHGGLGSGLVGDHVGDRRNHGGDHQAVYAYAREDLDNWAERLGRPLPNGSFGENLTTTEVDVTGALIGERWRVGPEVVLEVAVPRVPCSTFAGRMSEPGWLATFMRCGVPGAYLRVVVPGYIRSGDDLEMVSRPDHDVTIGLVFRAVTLEPDMLPRLLAAHALPETTLDRARRRAERSATNG